jgi:hypothetical protein
MAKVKLSKEGRKKRELFDGWVFDDYDLPPAILKYVTETVTCGFFETMRNAEMGINPKRMALGVESGEAQFIFYADTKKCLEETADYSLEYVEEIRDLCNVILRKRGR